MSVPKTAKWRRLAPPTTVKSAAANEAPAAGTFWGKDAAGAAGLAAGVFMA